MLFVEQGWRQSVGLLLMYSIDRAETQQTACTAVSPGHIA